MGNAKGKINIRKKMTSKKSKESQDVVVFIKNEVSPLGFCPNFRYVTSNNMDDKNRIACLSDRTLLLRNQGAISSASKLYGGLSSSRSDNERRIKITELDEEISEKREDIEKRRHEIFELELALRDLISENNSSGSESNADIIQREATIEAKQKQLDRRLSELSEYEEKKRELENLEASSRMASSSSSLRTSSLQIPPGPFGMLPIVAPMNEV